MPRRRRRLHARPRPWRLVLIVPGARPLRASGRARPRRRARDGGRFVSERLVDAAAVADRLGVPKTWVLESARAGAIPHVRLGRYVRFDLGDVDEWLASCKQPGCAIAFRK